MSKDYDDEYVEFASHALRELRRTAYLLCGDWHRAEDAVQDVLIRLYADGHGSSGAKGSSRTRGVRWSGR